MKKDRNVIGNTSRIASDTTSAADGLEKSSDSFDTSPTSHNRNFVHRFINAKSVVLIIIAALVIAVVTQMQKPLSPAQTKAAAGTASISLQPATTTLSSEQTVQVWVTVDRPVGFVHVNVLFDPDKVMLKSEPVFGMDMLRPLFPLTTREAANISGLITYIGAVGPDNKASAPTGTFSVGSFVLVGRAGTSSGDTSIGLTTQSQLVDMNAIPFALTLTGMKVTIPASPTIQPTSTRTPTLTPTGPGGPGKSGRGNGRNPKPTK